MGKIPSHLKRAIAANIRACRKALYPGRGGSQQCAAAFSDFIDKRVSPQQWSPWETGKRTPDEIRLAQIAMFFGKSVEDMRRDPEEHTRRAAEPPSEPAATAVSAVPDAQAPGLAMAETLMFMGRERMKAVYQVEVSVRSMTFVREEAESAPGGGTPG